MPFVDLPIDFTHEVTPVTAHCIETVVNHFDIHPDILYAILMVEGGTVGVENCHNVDGSCDLGVAQINETHLEELRGYGISRSMVVNNGCVNVAVAGWRVAESIKGQPVLSSFDYLRAIARYHSKTEKFNQIYQQRLQQAFAQMYHNE